MLRRDLIAALVVSMIGTVVNAADFYVGAGLGGKVDAGSLRGGLESLSRPDGDSWRLLAGVELGRNLALEVGRHDLGDQHCCRGAADLGFRSAVDGYSAAALGRWPAGRLTLFAKAGLLAWEETGETVTLLGPRPHSEDGTDLLLGAGVDVDLSSGFAVRADWERYEFDSSSSDAYWVSLLYRF